MEGLKLEEINEKSLPVSVEICSEKKRLIILSKRRRTKAIARLVNDSDRLFEIPKDYPGWFAISKEGLEPKTDYETNLNDIFNSGCENFMIIKSLKVNFAKLTNNNTVQLMEEKILRPGEILKIIKICCTTNAEQGEKIPSEHDKQLICLDGRNRYISLPLNSSGQFYTIGGKKFHKYNSLFQIDFIFNHFEFPINIKLAFSHVPICLKSNFDGLLTLIENMKNDSFIVGYPNFPEKMIVQEIPIKTNLRFKIVENLKNDLWLSKVNCNLYKYVTNIKELNDLSTPAPYNLNNFDESEIIFPEIDNETKMSTTWMQLFYETKPAVEPILRDEKINSNNRESTVSFINAAKSGRFRPISIREETLVDAYC